MRGIVLAGGRGTRLHPATRSVSKQLLPVYNKPMIYYPLSVLMTAGIREILVITTPEDRSCYERLLGDGARWGIRVTYVVQDAPRGLADAFRVGRGFVDGDRVALVLGDNILHGSGLAATLRRVATFAGGALIFAHFVDDPSRHGVVEFDASGRPLALVEKPLAPRSRWAVPGLYFYDEKVCELAAELSPSPRGEYEITDLNRVYLARGELHVERLTRGTAWIDAGTHESLLQASNYVQAVEHWQNLLIGSPEESAFVAGFIDARQLAALSDDLPPEYAERLRSLLDRPLEAS